MTDLERAEKEFDEAKARLKSCKENGRLTADLIPQAEANLHGAYERWRHAMIADSDACFKRQREKKKAERHAAWIASAQLEVG